MKQERYKFSFTAVSLQVPVMVTLASKMKDEGLSAEQLKPEDLGKERARTNRRQYREMRDRLSTLSEKELNLLVKGDAEEQGLIAFITFARAYRFFNDFMMEVVREKVTVFDFVLTDMDYNIFFNRKALDHPEVERLATSTQKKVRSVMFKVMEEAGILNNTSERKIQVPLLSTKLRNVLADNLQNLLLLLN